MAFPTSVSHPHRPALFKKKNKKKPQPNGKNQTNIGVYPWGCVRAEGYSVETGL